MLTVVFFLRACPISREKWIVSRTITTVCHFLLFFFPLDQLLRVSLTDCWAALEQAAGPMQ